MRSPGLLPTVAATPLVVLIGLLTNLVTDDDPPAWGWPVWGCVAPALLGPAGSGKSTELLRLAGTLVDRAERDADELIPVVLSLAGWGVTRWTGLTDVLRLARPVVPPPWPHRLGGVALGALLGVVLAAPLPLAALDQAGWVVPSVVSAWCAAWWVLLSGTAVFFAFAAGAVTYPVGWFAVVSEHAFGWATPAHVPAGVVAGPVVAAVVERDLVGRTGHGYRVEDPIVAAVLAAGPGPGDRDAPRAWLTRCC